ncbi:hypothetical protein CH063_12124, partial [Colletotrichum higginsianum]
MNINSTSLTAFAGPTTTAELCASDPTGPLSATLACDLAGPTECYSASLLGSTESQTMSCPR